MTYTCKPSKIAIYVNTGRKTAARIKSETGCTALINGGLFDMMTFKPVCHLKANGAILAKDQYKYWGYAWNADKPALVEDYASYMNYISCVCMVRDGKAEKMYYNAVGGARERTAIGMFADGRIWLYCDKTLKTPEQLQQIALSAGVQSALMLDGGGSTQGIFPSGAVAASRIVHNYICVWEETTTGGKTTEDKNMSYKICLDAGHGGNENYNCSSDKSYYEHEFTLDLAKRLKALLTPYMDVVMTRETDTGVALSDRASIANNAGVNAFVSLHSNAVSGTGWNNANGLCVYTYAAGGQREALAKSLLTSFTAAGIKLHGATPYHANFTVLAKTNMPAVLIEYGFHTNESDVELLKTSAYRDKLAEATAKGICEYFGITYAAPKATVTTSPAPVTTANGIDANKVLQQLIDAGMSMSEMLVAIANRI